MYEPNSSSHAAYMAHQRKIVRRFAPHLTNDELQRQERSRIFICLVRVLLVLAIPTTAVVYLLPWFVESPAFMVVAFLCLIEMVIALVRSSIVVRVCAGCICDLTHTLCGGFSTATVCFGQKDYE